MADAEGGQSKSAKRRAAKKAKAVAEPEEGNGVPEPKAKAKAEAKAKSEAKPKAESKPEVKAEPKAESKPKAAEEPKAADPKAKSKSKTKTPKPAAPEPKKEPAKPADPTEQWDDGTGGDWEVCTGASKKQERQKQRKEEKAKQEAAAKAQAVATGGKAIPGMAPAAAPAQSIPGMAPAKPAADQSVTAVPVVAATPAPEAPKAESSSAVITVPEKKIGIVIGPKGATIKMIQEKTTARVDTTGNLFTVTGSPQGVADAAQAINDLIEKGYTAMAFEDFNENSVQVHPSSFPDIIGKEGKIIRKLKEELGVEVTIPPVPKGTGGNKKYKVTIAGKVENVEKAKDVINDIIMYYHHEITHPGEIHEEFTVPTWSLSFIIGKGGSEMRHIQNNFKVKVYIPRETSTNQNVVVVGEPSGVARAKAYIDKTLANAETGARRERGTEGKNDGDVWGDEDEEEPWMKQYMYKR